MKTKNHESQDSNLVKFEVRLNELIEVGQALAEHKNFQLFQKVHYVSGTQSVVLHDQTLSTQKVTVNMNCDFVIVNHDGIEHNLSIDNWNSLCRLVQSTILKVEEITDFIKKA